MICKIGHDGRIGRIVFLCLTPNPSPTPSVKTPQSARTRGRKGTRGICAQRARAAHGEARKRAT